MWQGMRRPDLLALDGGGSKVDAALLSIDGQVLGAARWDSGVVQGPAGSDGGGRDGDELGLGPAVEAACVDADLDPGRRPVADLGLFCLAGADLPADHQRIEDSIESHGWTAETVLRNDTFAVLRAGSARSWGVAVVCGAGTNCAAVAPDGRSFRFPALGHLSGDWGGGHDIGRAALWHAVRAEDGRGGSTALKELVPQHFGLDRPSQLVEALYFGRWSDRRLVELPPLVFAAARHGDQIAVSIVERQADEVVTMVVTALRRLGMDGQDGSDSQQGLDVVLGGGIFRSDHSGLIARIEHGISRVVENVQVQVVTGPPLVGAALLGLDRLGATPQAMARARGALTHARLLHDDGGDRGDG